MLSILNVLRILTENYVRTYVLPDTSSKGLSFVLETMFFFAVNDNGGRSGGGRNRASGGEGSPHIDQQF